MFFLEEKNRFKSFSRRTILLLGIKTTFIALVGLKLFNIQIKDSKKYKTLSENNRINLKIVFPTRGIILDRNSNIIASNYEKYELFIVPEEAKNVDFVIKDLSTIFPISFEQRKKITNLSKKVQKFEMIKIFSDLEWSELEKIESNMYKFPGLHIITSTKRFYPYKNYFSHIIGYTNLPSKEDMQLPFISKMPSLDIGRNGIEKIYNESLIGIPGSREVEVDSRGKEIREVSKLESQNGDKLILSIDLRVQKIIYEEIKDQISGSVVVMNIHTGEVLGMASFPDFNPNKLINKPNQKYWDQILNNELKPLNNRAVQGLYAPGSTFKMVVALAALEKRIINLEHKVFCKGKIEFGERFYHCWKTEGHGSVNLIKGIKESCDCFFYDLANKVGIESIHNMAREMGLGEITKIELPFEKEGIVPNKKWKKQKLNESWYAGETLITGIGQGFILATPLQLALMTSLIANGGKIIKPTLIKTKIDYENPNSKVLKMNVSEDNLNIIKNAMNKVVNEPGGTAYRSRSNSQDYIYAGKTGTSQVKRITLEERESEEFRKKEIEWKDKDHGLFVGYMPVLKPKFAISVVIEHSGSGAATAAPMVKNIFNNISKMRI